MSAASTHKKKLKNSQQNFKNVNKQHFSGTTYQNTIGK